MPDDKKNFLSFLSSSNTVFDKILNRGQCVDSSDAELYSALGYPTSISYDDYLRRYRRQDIAQRVVRAPVDATWRYDPIVTSKGDPESEFTDAWNNLAEKTTVYRKLHKADLLANLGQYSVLYIGFDKSINLSEPPRKFSDVSYFTPVSEKYAKIDSFDENIWSERYGLPMSYTVESSADVSTTTSTTVSWERVVHIAENTLESEVYGIPILESVYNRLIGLDKLAGGSPEMYWQGARPGYVAQAADNSILNDAQLEQIYSQLSDFVNNLTRWMFSEGIKIQSLSPQVVTPKDHVEVQLKLISSATQIPLRILVGSEKGELASGQDERAWLSYIDARREQIAEKTILRPLIDRLITTGTLPTPKDGYSIAWKSINITSEKERAEIGRILTDALLKYTSSPGGSAVIPIDIWLEKVWNFSEAEIESLVGSLDKYVQEEDKLREVDPEEE